MSQGRRPPRMPPPRSYSFGVAGSFVDYMEERDEQQREAVYRWRAIARLYCIHYWTRLWSRDRW